MEKSLEKQIARIRENFFGGRVYFPAVLELPLLESAAGEPLTFITLLEWLSAPWPDFCPGEEWVADPQGAALREDSALLGLWLSWRARFMGVVLSMRDAGKEVRIRRLSGERVGKHLVEEVLSPEALLGQDADIFATMAVLRDPVFGDWACVTCTLHDAGGSAYAAAAGWNAGVVDFGETFGELSEWAERTARLAGRFIVWEDTAHLKPYPLGVEPATMITLPYAEAGSGVRRDKKGSRGVKGGTVVPFPARRAPRQ
ncbi:hypothetical protein SAMN00808754_1478 [Thermanaeromonas toyohensis ToBE]|uniref:Uncharacterized protein n=2 Tax=Thermanaeromonas TaxID=202949 RepID=A0A1W1VT06_9FIRM|nr:hypothetical protein SAMN00808754_1478 [Thermanaeromonas toyohensis ToBE]